MKNQNSASENTSSFLNFPINHQIRPLTFSQIDSSEDPLARLSFEKHFFTTSSTFASISSSSSSAMAVSNNKRMNISSSSVSGKEESCTDQMRKYQTKQEECVDAKSEQVKLLMNEKKFNEALHLIQKKTNTLSVNQVEYFLWITLKVYCHLRTKDLKSALDTLINVEQYVDISESEFLSNSKSLGSDQSSNICLNDHIPFSLRLLNAYLRDISESYNYCAYTNMYKLVKFCDNMFNFCRAAENNEKISSNLLIQSSSDSSFSSKLVLLWSERHTTASHILAELLTINNSPHEALVLLRQEVLSRRSHHLETLSLLGRICLRMGAVDSAEEYFQYAICVCGSHENLVTIKINNALLALSSGDTERSVAEFRDVFLLSPNRKGGDDSKSPRGSLCRMTEPTESDKVQSSAPLVCHPTLRAVSGNNLSVAYLYAASVDQSIVTLETSIKQNPMESAFATAVKNLNILYEFSSNKSKNMARMAEFLSNNSFSRDYSHRFLWNTSDSSFSSNSTHTASASSSDIFEKQLVS